MIKEDTRTSILLLMPLKIEYEAVRKHLHDIEEIFMECVRYETGKYQGAYHKFNVVIVQTGMTNTKMGLATEKAIQHFQPAAIFVVGIAGGVKDVEKGDVVVAEKVYGYEFGKETKEGYVSRPEVVNFDRTLLSVASSVVAKSGWQRKISITGKPPKVVFGAIASGDKVITSRASSVYKKINRHFNDTLALEMEAIGFGKAVLPHPHIRRLVIRSISDLLDNKSVTDNAGYQYIAAERAAAFLFGILDELELNKIKVGTPHNRVLVEEMFCSVLEMIQQKTIREITKNDLAMSRFREFMSGIIVTDSYKELSEDSYNEISQRELKYSLMKLMKTSELLQNEAMEVMMKIGKGKQFPGNDLNIMNSKNIIRDGKINGDRDLRLHGMQ